MRTADRLVSAPIEDHKIPRLGTAIVVPVRPAMNLLLAAHSLGYVAGWVTGWRLFEQAAKLSARPGERIAGFIFIGTPGSRPGGARRPALSDGLLSPGLPASAYICD